MKKSFVAMSLIVTMLLSTMIYTVRAEQYAIQWGYDAYDTFTDLPSEHWMETNLCDFIRGLFFAATYSYDMGLPPLDLYWTYTNNSCVDQCMSYQVQYCNFVDNWWVGDFHPSNPKIPLPDGHLWFYGNYNHDGHFDWDPSADIQDNEIYCMANDYGSMTSVEGVNFIWTCSSAGLYWDQYGDYGYVYGITEPASPYENPPSFTPQNTNTNYGKVYDGTVVGMPFAFTGRTDLYTDAYHYSDSTNYCYIGFEGDSPWICNVLPGTDYPLANFPECFYWCSIGFGANLYDWVGPQNIHNSLDSGSWSTFGCYFDESTLYNGWWQQNLEYSSYWTYSSMKVFGNAGLSVYGG
jgi:hypothetical protein